MYRNSILGDVRDDKTTHFIQLTQFCYIGDTIFFHIEFFLSQLDLSNDVWPNLADVDSSTCVNRHIVRILQTLQLKKFITHT